MQTREIGKTEGFVWMAIGIAISVISWQTFLGSFQKPGPGFVGFIGGIFILGVGMIMIALKKRPKPSAPGADQDGLFRISSWPRLCYTVGLLLAYALLIDLLGYIVTTFLVMWGLFYNRKDTQWFHSCFAALVSVITTYIVFVVWLRIDFPRGIFPWR